MTDNEWQMVDEGWPRLTKTDQDCHPSSIICHSSSVICYLLSVICYGSYIHTLHSLGLYHFFYLLLLIPNIAGVYTKEYNVLWTIGLWTTVLSYPRQYHNIYPAQLALSMREGSKGVIFTNINRKAERTKKKIPQIVIS